MATDLNTFKDVTGLVIQKLEGGYYNPDWHSTADSRYGSSGETMYGIDRKAGGSINTTSAGQNFWSLIDKNKSKEVWKWNYIPPEPLKTQLRELASELIYPSYLRNANNYLNPKTREIVDKDSRLLFHFIYATWNGPGWFKKFATDMNNAVDSGVTNPDKLVQIAIDSRTKEGLKKGSPPNSLIAQGGNKIAGFIESVKDYAKSGYNIAKKNPIPTALITMLLIVSGYVLYTQLKKK
jgi:hypothetical protein